MCLMEKAAQEGVNGHEGGFASPTEEESEHRGLGALGASFPTFLPPPDSIRSGRWSLSESLLCFLSRPAPCLSPIQPPKCSDVQKRVCRWWV